MAAALLAAPSGHADVISVPKGCEGFLTVQSKGCGVSHYWRCADAPDGTVWEAHYDIDGAFSLSVYDDEFQWLDSRYFTDGTREQLIEPGPDPASLSNLLSSGHDTYAFVVRETTASTDREIVHQGFDRLTGVSIKIDGLELLETEFSSTALDAVSGEEIYAVSGHQYVLEEERLFFLGPDTFRQDGEERHNDLTPLQFIRAGEPGFSDMTPRFDCEQTEDILFRPSDAGQSE